MVPGVMGTKAFPSKVIGARSKSSSTDYAWTNLIPVSLYYTAVLTSMGPRPGIAATVLVQIVHFS